MASGPETKPGIDPRPNPEMPQPRYPHVVAGMHIGRMAMTLPERFGAVLTVAERPGTVPDHVAHRHQHLSYFEMDLGALDDCVSWVLGQLAAERVVLIRSEAGRQRPALVAGLAILGLGGYYADAVYCVRKGDPHALTDFRYLQLLRNTDEAINARLRKAGS